MLIMGFSDYMIIIIEYIVKFIVYMIILSYLNWLYNNLCKKYLCKKDILIQYCVIKNLYNYVFFCWVINFDQLYIVKYYNNK